MIWRRRWRALRLTVPAAWWYARQVWDTSMSIQRLDDLA